MFKKIILILLLLTTSTSFAANQSYVDVSKNAWYYGEVKYASDKLWVRGYGDDTFKPNQGLTIGEALHITLKMLGYKQPSDVDWMTWTEETSMKANLILPLEFMDLTQPLSRKEMVLIGLRAIDKPLESDYMGFSQKIKDLNEVNYYWQQVLIKGYAQGIVTGYGQGYLMPNQTMTRAEGVTIINRLFKKI